MVSVYLESRWMTAFAVTDITVDARYPTMQVDDDGIRIRLTYETPDGLITQNLLFEPDTITDDINPQIDMSFDGVPMEVPQH